MSFENQKNSLHHLIIISNHKTNKHIYFFTIELLLLSFYFWEKVFFFKRRYFIIECMGKSRRLLWFVVIKYGWISLRQEQYGYQRKGGKIVCIYECFRAQEKAIYWCLVVPDHPIWWMIMYGGATHNLPLYSSTIPLLGATTVALHIPIPISIY